MARDGVLAGDVLGDRIQRLRRDQHERFMSVRDHGKFDPTPIYSLSGAFNAPDWFEGTPNVAYSAGARVSLDDGIIQDYGGPPYLYYSLISLSPADLLKTVTSVELTQPEGAGYSYVMALSGAVPEPAALVPMTIGCAFILVYTRRRLFLRF
jgi:hypothetical protein